MIITTKIEKGIGLVKKRDKEMNLEVIAVDREVTIIMTMIAVETSTTSETGMVVIDSEVTEMTILMAMCAMTLDLGEIMTVMSITEIVTTIAEMVMDMGTTIDIMMKAVEEVAVLVVFGKMVITIVMMPSVIKTESGTVIDSPLSVLYKSMKSNSLMVKMEKC